MVKSHRLSAFLDRVAYWFIKDPDFQATVDAAGINFEGMAGSFENFGVESVQGYLTAFKETKSHEFAKARVQRNLDHLARSAGHIRMTGNYEAIGHEFQQLISEEGYLVLADLLKANPQAGKEILESFEIDAPTFARGGIVKGIMHEENAKFEASLKEKTVMRMIQDFPILSRIIGGWNSGRFTIMTGKTGFGKTNLALALALSAQKDYGVAYVNMEMSYADIFKRLAVNILNCKYDDLTNELVYSKMEMDLQLDAVMTPNFFMTDGKTLSIKEVFGAVRAKNREFEKPIRLLIIDYDQRLARNEEGGEDAEWRYLLKDAVQMEDFAKEQDLHVILMCQLNRQGQIAASQRMLNIAHTWLDFYKDDEHGPMIHAKKNRHGPTNHGVRVKYTSAKVEEIDEIFIDNH